MITTDVLIIGASASGLMCAIEAGKRQRKVIVLDHANKAGKKILMSGGGRCNFTNYDVSAENFISQNSHFCKSALSRFTQWDFLAMVQAYNIPFHERLHGQLFCDVSAKDILAMLLSECKKNQASVHLKTTILSIEKVNDNGFKVATDSAVYFTESLVIATGGLSIPKMGATPFGYKVAEQFGLQVQATRAGLVPFTLQPEDKARFSALSGIAVDSIIHCGDQSFRENILFTHRGLSGPVILQISSYWTPGDSITVNLLPDQDIFSLLLSHQQDASRQKIRTLLYQWLPQRLVNALISAELLGKSIQDTSHKQLQQIASEIHDWQIIPSGTEGYRTAEVTLGGVNCHEVSSKTFEANHVPGLYFVGEVLDVTGWLGGFNFQWAWSSAWCAGQFV